MKKKVQKKSIANLKLKSIKKIDLKKIKGGQNDQDESGIITEDINDF